MIIRNKKKKMSSWPPRVAITLCFPGEFKMRQYVGLSLRMKERSACVCN